MTMLKSGWVIVGSTPSTDGTTRTKGDGCLIVLDPQGNVAEVWAGPNINDPWGNMAVLDNGTTAMLFISMSGFDLPAPGVHDPATGNNVIVRKAKVMRLTLAIPDRKPPVLKDETVVGDGFAQQADLDNFLFGPTGVALAPDNTIYVSDGLGNAIVKIPDATTRTTSAGTGQVVTKDGLLKNPLALIWAPNGHLLACNGLNGQIVEIDPVAGKQIYAQWLDVDQAQSPPGNGDLFGLAVKPDGSGLYYVEDDTNTLVEDTP
jgi:DNA-binding beta-propeller fold protein YncE